MSEQTYSALLYGALLQATSDWVLVLQDERLQGVSPGDSLWLNPEVLLGRSLEEVYPAELVSRLRVAMARIKGKPGQVEQLEYALRPEQAPMLKEAGLKEVVWFEGRLVYTANGELVWCNRDINERKRLQRKVSNQAQRDPLTGAYNRRALVTVMEQTVAQALRYDWTCSVLLIDIDDFSGINDQFGWDAGDQLLQQIVTGVHKMKRTSDFLARYGDDQLVLFVPETNHDQAVAAGERVRKLVQELEIPYPTGELRGTASIGVASLQGLEDGAVEMLRRASENLMVARNSGGNRVEGEAS